MSLSELSQTPGKVESIVMTSTYHADPLSIFSHLCSNSQHALLLESAEIDSKDDLKSLLLIDAAVRFECRGNRVSCVALTGNGESALAAVRPELSSLSNGQIHNIANGFEVIFDLPSAEIDEDKRLKSPAVFDALRSVVTKINPLRDHQHALFLGGVFAYDLLASFERLPEVDEGDNDCPDFVFYLAETLLLLDHQAQHCELVGSIFSGDEVAASYFSLSQRLEQLHSSLSAVPRFAPSHSTKVDADDLTVNKDDCTFKQHVVDLKEHIKAGDIFQVVPSRTYQLPCPNPLLAYAALKTHNPSPYMFYMQDATFSIFGASPESALKYDAQSNQVEVYPIAGTRPRGKRVDGSLDLDLDSRIELNLRDDTKEKAEHLMLVDLARNDVAKVATPGTRHVKDLLKVDRYSHVMHLVSRVVGQLREDLDALHAYQACMNMGTLVGAPKVSAASLIRKVEGKRRGSYGGAVGYINGCGDMDTCIVIRSAFVKNNIAFIQAGAGVVFDSDPQSEADETRSKAQAVIHAIITSHTGH